MDVDSKKLEFMASLNLVPPAVLEEIHRRQMLCRVELGNWWERQHSKDFCLVQRDSNCQANDVGVDMPTYTHHTLQSSVDVQTVTIIPDTHSNSIELVQPLEILRSKESTSSPCHRVQQATPPQSIFVTTNIPQ